MTFAGVISCSSNVGTTNLYRPVYSGWRDIDHALSLVEMPVNICANIRWLNGPHSRKSSRSLSLQDGCDYGIVSSWCIKRRERRKRRDCLGNKDGLVSTRRERRDRYRDVREHIGLTEFQQRKQRAL